LFVELSQKVDGLARQVGLLTAEVCSVKNFEGQASEVIGHLVKLGSVLRSLENLGKIGESLQKITDLLGKVSNTEEGEVLVDSRGQGSFQR